jgi:hypothetical protein
VNWIFVSLATAAAFLISGCGFFGNAGEMRQQQSGKTVFKSAGESETATPAPQKVPGE